MAEKQKSGCLGATCKVLGILLCIIGVICLLAGGADKEAIPAGIFALVLGIVMFFIAKGASKKVKGIGYNNSDVYLTPEQILKLERAQEIPVVQTPLFLKPGETAVFYCKATKQESKNKIIGRTGGYGGVSFRIAKGLTLHSGRTASRPIYGDVYSHFPGQFVMTTHRFVFINDKKGFEIPYDKLTAFQLYFDAISVQVKNTTHILLLPRPDLVNALFAGIHNVGVEKFAEMMIQFQQNKSQQISSPAHVCSCGTAIDGKMKFCPNCGTQINQENVQSDATIDILPDTNTRGHELPITSTQPKKRIGMIVCTCFFGFYSLAFLIACFGKNMFGLIGPAIAAGILTYMFFRLAKSPKAEKHVGRFSKTVFVIICIIASFFALVVITPIANSGKDDTQKRQETGPIKKQDIPSKKNDAQ